MADGYGSEAEEVFSSEESVREESVVDSEEDLGAGEGFVVGADDDEDELEDDDGADVASMIDDRADEDVEMSAEQRQAAEAEIRARESQQERRGGLQGVAALFQSLPEDPTIAEDMHDDTFGEDDRNRFKQIRERTVKLTRPDHLVVQQAKEALPECVPALSTSQYNERIGEFVSCIFEGLLWYLRTDPATGQVQIETGDAPATSALYLSKIQEMVREERRSLLVEWSHLMMFEAKLIDWLIYVPKEMIDLMSECVTNVCRCMFPSLYDQEIIVVRVHASNRISSIRQLTTKDINTYITVEGVCVRRTDVLPKLQIMYYKCLKCQYDSNGPYTHQMLQGTNGSGRGGTTLTCINCQATNGLVLCRERTVFENYQKLYIQEMTSEVPPGHIPRQKAVVVLGDMVDTIRPGDEITVSGILETAIDVLVNARMNFPVFNMWIVANHIQRRRDGQLYDVTDHDRQIIKRLSQNKMIRSKLIRSIAPSIWGHIHAKTAIAMSLFGGVRIGERKDASGPQHNIRGDVNVLLVGDPGMGKSQLLKFVSHVFPRTILTTGKGASGVGLTASVKRDHITGEWTLEGGAFVLADDGICLIDEFDKMNDQDRVSIHEAMEQQSISLSKAGIVATLRARCSVIAAANPIGGHYATALTLPENVELSDPILSRFDVVAIVKDEIYPISDQHLANHVLSNHIEAHPQYGLNTQGETASNAVPEIDETLDAQGFPQWVSNDQRLPDKYLRLYILFARQNIHPQLRDCDEQKIVNFYTRMRQATNRYAGSMPMTVRHLESVFRMSAANAKMRLSPIISSADIDYAISTMFESFVQSQKHSVARALSQTFSKYRALASSPFELLHDILKSAIATIIDQKYCSLMLQESSTGECSVEVPVNEFKRLALTTHEIPEACIDKWIQSPKFPSIYRLIEREGNTLICCSV